MSSFTYGSGTGQSTMTNPLSQVSTYIHDSGRNLIQDTDPAGHAITKSYDSNSRPVSHKDADGNATAWSWQATGLIAIVTNPDSGRVSYTYTSSTANGFTYYDLAGTTFADGTSESYVFDSGGNLTSRTSRTGQQWKNTYNSKGQPLTLTAPNGGVVTYTYSADGKSVPVTAAYPNTSLVTLAFDNLKRLTAETFSDGSAAAFTYDANDFLLTFTNEVGAVTAYTYDANGNVASVKDPDGGTSTFSYTGTDKIATATDAAGRTVTINYDPADRPAKLTFGDGSVYQYGYDASGNVVSVTDGEGKVWKQGYDPAGTVNSFTTPLNAQTVFTVDSMARLTKVATPAGKTISYAYDRMGRPASVSDSQQHVTSYSYDKNGETTGIAIPGGIAATYTLDAIADLATIADPNGNPWNFTYDGAGRSLSQKDPLGRATTYKRDARGRVTSATMPLGTMTATVDAAGRVTHAAFSDNTGLDYAWDPAGRLTSATGLTFQYDASGALSNSNGLAIATDKLARATQVTLAAGKTLNYTYDHRGLVTQVTDWVGGNTTFQYDDAGQLTSLKRPNGITTTYTYDADGAVASIQEAGVATLSSILLTRDTRGLVTSATRNVPLSPTAAQLASLPSTHTYDAGDQIAEFQYDAMGRRTSDDTRSSYTWDLAGRMTGYVASGDSASFTYNAFGWIASQTHGGLTSQYVWNFGLGLPSISVVRSGGTDAAYYVHAPNGALLHSVDGTGKRRYYHYDETGNTIFLTDDTGAITDKFAYTEYGALLSPAATDSLFLFQGQYGGMQIGNGLYAMRQRIYDSRSGAFLSREPALLAGPQVVNPYEYSVGNPMGFRDVTGAEPTQIPKPLQDAMWQRLSDRFPNPFLSSMDQKASGVDFQKIDACLDRIATRWETARWIVESPVRHPSTPLFIFDSQEVIQVTPDTCPTNGIATTFTTFSVIGGTENLFTRNIVPPDYMNDKILSPERDARTKESLIGSGLLTDPNILEVEILARRGYTKGCLTTLDTAFRGPGATFRELQILGIVRQSGAFRQTGIGTFSQTPPAESIVAPEGIVSSVGYGCTFAPAIPIPGMPR